MHGESEEACKTLLCSAVDCQDDDSMHSHFHQPDYCHCACNFSYHISNVAQFIALSETGPMPEFQGPLYTDIPFVGIDHIPRV